MFSSIMRDQPGPDQNSRIDRRLGTEHVWWVSPSITIFWAWLKRSNIKASPRNQKTPGTASSTAPTAGLIPTKQPSDPLSDPLLVL